VSAEVRLQAKVLTVSDAVEAGAREDRGGIALVARLEAGGFEVIERRAVAADVAEVSNALSYMAYGFNGLIVTAGGTGFEPRDITPEATRRILDRTAPGLGDAMRGASPQGRLSRAIAGTRGAALIVNVSGVADDAVEMLEAVVEVVPVALREMSGSRHQ
jgi:molybdopterin adenylyltransferase